MHDTIPQGKRLIVWRKYYLNARYRRRFRTICEVLREVYLDAENRGDAVTMTKMDEATDMAKRMQARLEEYSGGARLGLVKFENFIGWINKEQVFEITLAEASLIEAERAKAAKRAAKAAARAAKAAAENAAVGKA